MNQNDNSTQVENQTADESVTQQNNPDDNSAQNQSEQEQNTTQNQGNFCFDNILVKRLLATFIDMVIVGVAAVLLALPAMFVLPSRPVNLGMLFSFIVYVAAAAIILVKDMPFEFMGLDGQTPGKKAMNIRVTDLNKEPITMEKSIKRNIVPASGYIVSALSALLNVVHIPFITGLASLFVIVPLFLVCMCALIYEVYQIYSDPMHRRWGDNLAGTVVSWE